MNSARLLSEYRDVVKAVRKKSKLAPTCSEDPPPLPTDHTDVILFPKSEDNILTWTAYIVGPSETPFEKARFQLRISIPQSYPYDPPKIFFVTNVCHPNVHFKTGEVCVDFLKKNWVPAWTLDKMCIAVISLLGDPDESSPLNCDAGNLIRNNDIRGYHSLAKMYVREHAQLLE